MPGQGGMESRLPVFTTPQQQINFYADDPQTFKQILTLYNPYDFLVKFKLFCTDRSKYTVSFSQGQIKSNHSVDIVVQHKAVIPTNIGVTDVIRIQVYSSGQVRSSGKKDISIILLSTAPRERAPPPTMDTEQFQQLEVDSAAAGHLRQNPLMHERNTNVIILYSFLIVVFVTFLSLPKVGDESELLPESMPRPTCEMKIWAAFVLGIVTALLIRT